MKKETIKIDKEREEIEKERTSIREKIRDIEREGTSIEKESKKIKEKLDEIKKTDSVNNPYYNNHVPGMVPQFINEQAVNVMIAGGMGPRAIDMFSNLGMEVVTGAIGNVGNVLQAYLRGEISGVEPCEHDYPGGHNHR